MTAVAYTKPRQCATVIARRASVDEGATRKIRSSPCAIFSRSRLVIQMLVPFATSVESICFLPLFFSACLPEARAWIS